MEDMVKEVELKEGIKEKINQLQVYADKNDNIIWYDRVVDILSDKDDSVTDEMIEAAIRTLGSRNQCREKAE